MWSYSVRIDHLPVVLGAIAGVVLAVVLAPRRALVPLAALVLLYAVYLLEGAGGASVIDRYLTGAATVALLFCAVTVGGWWMLEPGTGCAAAWIAVRGRAGHLRGGVGGQHDQPHEPAHHAGRARGLPPGAGGALHNPAGGGALRRCPLVSLPNNKLIPDARWILDSVGQRDIVARSQARGDAARGAPELSERLKRGSVAVYPLGSAVFSEAIVDVGDDPLDQVPPKDFRRVYTSRYYAVYANC